MTTVEIDIPLINYSEFNAMSACERKWQYAYVNLEEEQATNKQGMHLGTLLHLGLGQWQVGEGVTLPTSWTDDINVGGKPGDAQTLWLKDFDPETVQRAEWLLQRYVEHYGSQPPSSWNVISAEKWLSRDFGRGKSKWRLVGRSDGAVEIDGNIWLLERKSYGSKARLDYVHVDPQLGCYSLLFEKEYGVRPYGVIYDGIYTYEWALKKPTQATLIEERLLAEQGTEGLGDGLDITSMTKAQRTDWARGAVERHPGVQVHGAEESFERRYVDIGDEHLRVAQEYLAGAIRRQRVLKKRPGDAIPNVGRDCSWCGFKERCWADLGGGDEEIGYDDEEGDE